MPTGKPSQYRAEGFKALRLTMVLSSLSPLFVLWGIRGTPLVPDIWFIPACAALALFPSAILYWRIVRARTNGEKRQLTVGTYDDSRKHLLVYLFATLLPFYRTSIVAGRDLVAMTVALAFIIILFWHLRLHYINLLLAVCDYRAYTIYAPRDGNPYTGDEPVVLLTFRHRLHEGDQIIAYRITDTVYLEDRHAT